MGLRALFLPLLLVPLLLAPAEAQQAVFPDVKVRFSRGKDRLLVEKGADLVFNDAARRLPIKSGDRPLDVAYDQVTKVVLERSLRGTDPGLAIAFGGLVGAAIHDDTRMASWAYLESAGQPPLLLLIGKESTAALRAKMQAVFGERVQVTQFAEVAQKLDKKTLAAAQAGYDVRADKQQHPAPELRPDKALVVVACPPINTRYAGKGNAKLYLDDAVVAANEMGSYTFFHVEPGAHRLVSEMGNASVISMDFEPGKAYYFLAEHMDRLDQPADAALAPVQGAGDVRGRGRVLRHVEAEVGSMSRRREPSPRRPTKVGPKGVRRR